MNCNLNAKKLWRTSSDSPSQKGETRRKKKFEGISYFDFLVEIRAAFWKKRSSTRVYKRLILVCDRAFTQLFFGIRVIRTKKWKKKSKNCKTFFFSLFPLLALLHGILETGRWLSDFPGPWGNPEKMRDSYEIPDGLSKDVRRSGLLFWKKRDLFRTHNSNVQFKAVARKAVQKWELSSSNGYECRYDVNQRGILKRLFEYLTFQEIIFPRKWMKRGMGNGREDHGLELLIFFFFFLGKRLELWQIFEFFWQIWKGQLTLLIIHHSPFIYPFIYNFIIFIVTIVTIKFILL